MFSYIKGKLEYISEDGIILENNGIGYDICTSTNVINKLPALHSEVMIYTYLQVREDDLSLFGFLDREELFLFKKLIGISGIGPKGAVSILSTLTVPELKMAIISDDSKAIAKANGIGAKTAQRVILDLKDKISLDVTDISDDTSEANYNGPLTDSSNDAILALVSLGYSNSEAMRAVRKIEDRESKDTSTLIREALRHI